MADVAILSVLLRADDQLTKKLQGAQDKMRAFGQRAGEVGRSLIGVAGPIAAIGAAGVLSFAKFEQTMARVGAVSGATAEEFERLENVAKEMGRTTVFTANESAQALAFMAQAGMAAGDSISALPKVLELAAAGQLELGAAADIVTNVMAGFGLTAEELGRANDVLVTGFTSANTDLLQLGQAFKFAGPVAKAAGLSFEETTAALSLLGNAGLQASMAGTGIRGAITKLLNPSKEASEAMGELGLQVLDAAGNMRPLTDIIAQLESSGLSAGDAMTIFGQRAGPAMLALVEQGAGALAELTTAMEHSGGVAGQIATDQLDTLQGSLTLLRSQVEAAALAIGEKFAPMVRDAAERLGPLVEGIIAWVQANPQLTAAIGIAAGVIATFGAALVGLSLVLPGIAALVPVLGGAFALMLGPLGLVVAAVTALALVFATDFLGIRTKTLEMVDAVVGALTGPFLSVWGTIQTTLSELVDGIIGIFDRFRDDPVKALGFMVGAIIGFFVSLPTRILSIASLVVGNIGDFLFEQFKTFGPIILDALQTIPGLILQFLRDLPSNIATGLVTFRDVLRSFMSGLFEGITFAIPEGVLGPLRSLAGKIADILDKVPGTVQRFIPGYSGLVDMLKGFSNIPGLQIGGNIKRGGMALVGERGPELVSLPTGATVHPNGSGAGRPTAIINVAINGPIFGMQDVEDLVAQSWVDVARAGGFDGIIDTK